MGTNKRGITVAGKSSKGGGYGSRLPGAAILIFCLVVSPSFLFLVGRGIFYTSSTGQFLYFLYLILFFSFIFFFFFFFFLKKKKNFGNAICPTTSRCVFLVMEESGAYAQLVVYDMVL